MRVGRAEVVQKPSGTIRLRLGFVVAHYAAPVASDAGFWMIDQHSAKLY
jgi:hypothetical protein